MGCTLSATRFKKTFSQEAVVTIVKLYCTHCATTNCLWLLCLPARFVSFVSRVCQYVLYGASICSHVFQYVSTFSASLNVSINFKVLEYAASFPTSFDALQCAPLLLHACSMGLCMLQYVSMSQRVSINSNADEQH